MTETYENIRDSELLTQDTRESFIRADQARRGLRREYEKLIEDESLNDEYRARRAQELFEQRKESVGAQGRRAREAILKQAKFAEQAATLRPSGEPLSSSSADRLLLDQNEAARIVRSSARRSPRGRSAPTLAATSVKSTLVDWRSAGSKADRYVAAPCGLPGSWASPKKR